MHEDDAAKIPLYGGEVASTEHAEEVPEGQQVSLKASTPATTGVSSSSSSTAPAGSSVQPVENDRLFPSGAPQSAASSGQYNTLDEPVMETIMRELRSIGAKIRYVLVPGDQQGAQRLRDWDLWGPLAFCLTMGCALSIRESAALEDAGDEYADGYTFALIFFIVWVGSAFVTLNAMLLGGKASFFMCVCVLGYCLFPQALASILVLLLGSEYHLVSELLKVVFVVAAFAWSSYASVGFIGGLVQEDRKVLAMYPVWLFYVAISWVILLT
mmetsp:Transcript_10150/g.22857  ORF Transcript_10150/g.22857 Transcript_10150/m.22857 type:complete len:270 (+) Transcript_10150:73-882(+)